VADLRGDTPILEQGILSSLDIVEFVLFIESLRGEDIDTDAIAAEDFTSIDTLYAAFFGGGREPGVIQELKRGGSRNLYLVHDGDGDTLLYMNLARRMPKDVAVFGIEPRRISRVPLPHARIEDMAACYVEEIRKKQPRGPYMLGGMCAGGNIAYEMASQLTRDGERVELVALLDAVTPQAPKRTGRITRQRFGRLLQAFAEVRGADGPLLRRVARAAQSMTGKLVNALTWEIAERARRWSTSARFRLLQTVLARKHPWPSFVPELSVRQIYESAEARWLPKHLRDARVLLVRARTGEAADTPFREIYSDETLGWGSVTDGLAVVDVDGGHSSMLQEPFAESLAAALVPHVTGRDTAGRVRIADGGRS
jgi:thioesterase domain-containing protein